MKSTMIDKKNIITYGDFVRMVDDICKQSINLDLDIVGRTKAAFAQYQECVKGKLFLYDDKKTPIPFDSISTQEIEQQIIAILKLYLCGKITDSITSTCALWNGDLINSATILTPKENNTLYRTRNTDKELTVPEKLFHAPFELRNSVGTARYSILGFPGLYLTRNLYTAWEESRQSDINTLYAARLNLQIPIRLIDLRVRKTFNVNSKDVEKEVNNYLATIPLIIACSLKVKDDTKPFKPEYILPQLLIHAVINEMGKQGLRSSGIKMSDSSMEIADELLQQLETEYNGDIEKMEKDVLAWVKSFAPQDNSIPSIAAHLLNVIVWSKYGYITHEQVLQLNDKSWQQYSNTKGLRKFAEGGFDGIIYSSTQTDINVADKINTDCIVLPVHSVSPRGYCPFLSRAFSITEPLVCKSDTLIDSNDDRLRHFERIEQTIGKMPLHNMVHISMGVKDGMSAKNVANKLLTDLQSLCESKDTNEQHVLDQIASILRMLLTGHGDKSLMEKAGDPNSDIIISSCVPKGGICFWDFGPNIHDKSFLVSSVYVGLLKKEVRTDENNKLTLSYQPLLDANSRCLNELSFEKWYKGENILELGQCAMTRRDVVEIITNRAGAWYQRPTTEAYQFFSNPKSLQLKVNGEDVSFNNNPVYVSLRQIAWEVLKTVENNR